MSRLRTYAGYAYQTEQLLEHPVFVLFYIVLDHSDLIVDFRNARKFKHDLRLLQVFRGFYFAQLFYGQRSVDRDIRCSFGYFTRKYPVSRIVSGNSPSLQLLADYRKSTARQLMILNRQADPT